MKRIENEKQLAGEDGSRSATSSGLPWGFEQREKMRAAEAKAYGASDASGNASGAYGGATPGTTAPSPNLAAAFAAERRAAPSAPAISAEVALLRVATHALETLTATLRAKPVPLDDDERAAFAAAVKKSLDAVLRCRR
jgi:hypothetical protein